MPGVPPQHNTYYAGLTGTSRLNWVMGNSNIPAGAVQSNVKPPVVMHSTPQAAPTRPPFIDADATIRSVKETMDMLKAGGYHPTWAASDIRPWGDDRYVPVRTNTGRNYAIYWAKM